MYSGDIKCTLRTETGLCGQKLYFKDLNVLWEHQLCSKDINRQKLYFETEKLYSGTLTVLYGHKLDLRT